MTEQRSFDTLRAQKLLLGNTQTALLEHAIGHRLKAVHSGISEHVIVADNFCQVPGCQCLAAHHIETAVLLRKFHEERQFARIREQ